MSTFTFVLHDDDREALDRAARKEGRDAGELVRDALREYLKKNHGVQLGAYGRRRRSLFFEEVMSGVKSTRKPGR